MRDEAQGYRQLERAELGIGPETPKGLKQQEKHERLWEAVRRVEAVSFRLIDLIDRVAGAPQSEQVDSGTPSPGGLAPTLDNAPDQLSQTAERMHKQIAEIEAMLFG